MNIRYYVEKHHARPRRGRRIKTALFAIVLSVAALPVLGLDLDGSLGGSYKSYFTGIYDAAFDGKSAGAAASLLRLNGSLYPADWLSLEAAYLLSPEIGGDTVEQTLGASSPGLGAEYRVIDPRRRLLPGSADNVENAALYHEIDRAMATLRFSFADLSVGRQAIAWGTARVVNPTDIIVPYRFTALDTEYRKGVDAVRFRAPLGSFSELDLGAVFGEDFQFERSAFFARGRLYVLQTDVSVLSMVFRENLLWGLSLSRAIGENGAWLEAAYVLPDAVDPPDDLYANDYVSLSVGVDRNIVADLYAYLEYHFNSAGEADPDDYLEAGGTPAYTEGNLYLLGRHYVGVGGTYNVSPLLPASALVLVNLNDLSVELSLSAEYNFKENVYVGGGVFLGLGPEPETLGGVPIRYRSEFGAYPQVIYTEVKLYF